jgi:cell pole-organizing protein PopZ
MSAINSNSDDRDLEAVRRAQRAYEPSMEEILASIRNIIADEREAGRSPAPKPASQAGASAAGPQIVYSKDDSLPPRATPEPSQRAEPTPAGDVNAPKVVWRKPQPAGAEPTPRAPACDEEPLLSAEANEAVVSSFEVLSANLALRSAEVADGLMREMLRPLLKQWLDENLPPIVERLVRAEIQRVARGQK